MEEILVFCASQHSQPVIDALEKEGRYKVSAIIDAFKTGEWFGYPVKDFSFLKETRIRKAVIARGDNWGRYQTFLEIEALCPDMQYVSVVHPSAVISRNVKIGPGAMILGGVVINAESEIGRHAIINTSATIEHDCKIGEFSNVLSGATLCGAVSVGRFSAVCAGSLISHGLKIGDHTVIGAGSVVLENVPDFSLAFGHPCKVKRPREKGEKYL